MPTQYNEEGTEFLHGDIVMLTGSGWDRFSMAGRIVQVTRDGAYHPCFATWNSDGQVIHYMEIYNSGIPECDYSATLLFREDLVDA